MLFGSSLRRNTAKSTLSRSMHPVLVPVLHLLARKHLRLLHHRLLPAALPPTVLLQLGVVTASAPPYGKRRMVARIQ